MIVKKNLEEDVVVSFVEATPEEQRRNRARMKEEAEAIGRDAYRESSVFSRGGRTGGVRTLINQRSR